MWNKSRAFLVKQFFAVVIHCYLLCDFFFLCDDFLYFVSSVSSVISPSSFSLTPLSVFLSTLGVLLFLFFSLSFLLTVFSLSLDLLDLWWSFSLVLDLLLKNVMNIFIVTVQNSLYCDFAFLVFLSHATNSYLFLCRLFSSSELSDMYLFFGDWMLDKSMVGMVVFPVSDTSSLSLLADFSLRKAKAFLLRSNCNARFSFAVFSVSVSNISMSEICSILLQYIDLG